MRIDFLARYRQVSEQIKSSSSANSPQVVEGKFGDTLADLAPQYLQPADKDKKIAPEAGPSALLSNDASHIRAQLNLAKLELLEPEFKPIEPGIIEEHTDNKTRVDVKTPTLVSIERHSAHGEVSVGSEAKLAHVRNIVEDAGERFGVDPSLGMAVVARESSFNPKAVSSDGHQSKGLFQLLDRTGRDLLNRLGLESEYKPFDPEQNVYLGVGYLRHLHDIFSKETDLPNKTRTIAAANNSSLEKLAVAAFNAGEGRVASAQQRAQQAGKDPSRYDHIEDYLPESTQQYVSKVLEAKAQFAGALSAPKLTR